MNLNPFAFISFAVFWFAAGWLACMLWIEFALDGTLRKTTKLEE